MAAGFDIRGGERAAVVLAMVALGAATAGHTLLETARDALFLAKLPPTTLPWMYIAIALVGVFVTRVIGARKASRTASLAMGIAGISAVGFWFWAQTPSPLMLYCLFVWAGTFGAIIGLELWMVLGTVFDVTQAKRLFGFIGSGAVLGATIGAFIARLIAGSLSTPSLLLAASVLFFIGTLPATLLERGARVARPAVQTTAPAESTTVPLRGLLRDPYLQLIALFLLFGTLTLTLGDYIFKSTLAHRVPKEELGSAFATIYLGYNALALIVQLGLTNLVLRTLGLPRSLLILPALMFLCAGTLAGLGGLAAAIALRGADGVFRHSIYKTTTELLYLPIVETRRRVAKPILDLLTQRGGQTLGAFIALAAVALGASSRTLGVLAAVFGALWCVMGARLGARYVDAFRQRLKSGELFGEDGVPELDLRALEAILLAFNSSRDPEVMGAMDLLASQGRAKLIPALVLYHPSRSVVLRAFDALTAASREDIVPIAKRLVDHQDPDVRAAAVRALGKLDPDGILLYANDPRAEVRVTAEVALMKTDEDAPSLERLNGLRESEDIAVQRALVRAIGESPDLRFVDMLLDFSSARFSVELRAEAHRGLGRHAIAFEASRRRVLEALTRDLGHRDIGAAARSALADIGPAALAYLDEVLDRPTAAHNTSAIARSLVDYPTELAVPIIVKHMLHSPEGRVRFRCLKDLCRLRQEHGQVPIDRTVIEKTTLSTLDAVFSHLESSVILEKTQASDPTRRTPAGELVVSLLKDKSIHARARVFLLLGLMYQHEDFDRVERALASSDAKVRASSRELCDNLLKGRLHDLFMLLFDDLTDGEKVARWRNGDPQRRSAGDYSAILAGLLQRSGSLGTLARFHASEQGESLASLTSPSTASTRPPAVLS